MAEVSPAPPSLSGKKKKAKRAKKEGPLAEAADSHRLELLPWNESLPNDDPFSLLAGSNEGGFLSLEEIDESEYGFVGGVPDPVGGEKKPKEKKRKRGSGDGDWGDDGSCVVQAEDGEKKKKKKQKKKKKKPRDKKKKEEEGVSSDNGEKGEPVEGIEDVHNNDDAKYNIDEGLLIDEDEVYAWKELRLHPLLIKSICRLGFKEPTPIQKACIPAAAHQGKDVIGAAETGSGKTLAFGLPILQRLLEEREKDARLLLKDPDEKLVEKGFKGGPLRALIVTPTRELAFQVSDHLKAAAKFLAIQVVPIVGGMSSEKQERLLKRRPEIIVGTPGRLWELMSAGEQHLVELHSLSFFVLDEADRMIENGHFHELQSIIDMLPMLNVSVEQSSQPTTICKTIPSLQRKKRQTFVFSATIALSDNFRKKLKHGSSTSKSSTSDGISSIEKLSERAGMRPDAAIVDLTNASIVATKLEESFIECSEEDKEAYLYYLLSVHGHGRTIVFCTSIAALRRLSSILHILGINSWTLHAQMQQRARLKAIDRFRGNEHAVLVATDIAARGLDIPGIRTVVHYQLPHSAEVYIHRSGRTARASADGCCIALVSPSDKTKFFSLCKSLLKESLRQFPVDDAYMPEVMKRLSLARQIDKIVLKNSQENAKKSWLLRNAESVELAVEDSGSEEETVKSHKQKKISSLHLKKLHQELNGRLARPLQPKSFSNRFLAGAGVSPLLQQQLEELSKKDPSGNVSYKENKRPGFQVIGQDCIEPLQALRSSGREVCVSVDKKREVRRLAETWKRKNREEKKRTREQQRKEKKKAKEGMK
ncbi:DEAD-box ATP-dependent RNA helicase 13 [Phoenix dactylifera]|uniref:ATP-dependent RNA helicase n=1 Tax=Phoenix dactylifera TaxID=42345 RepID=A0A8B7CL04_PHODC|nr:DEAD-box ATP-dependent RNA helicase 13 [Phoenix dactylifera]